MRALIELNYHMLNLQRTSAPAAMAIMWNFHVRLMEKERSPGALSVEAARRRAEEMAPARAPALQTVSRAAQGSLLGKWCDTASMHQGS